MGGVSVMPKPVGLNVGEWTVEGELLDREKMQIEQTDI